MTDAAINLLERLDVTGSTESPSLTAADQAAIEADEEELAELLVRVADDRPARTVPKSPGAANTLLEAGGEPTDLVPTPLAGLYGGPGLHPDQD
ncbi:hypothetical protein ACIPSA_39110 [Streptomyces sp. NPDC086549]|uniref:hypothetical protein n=1 Tax=Streptomyces sp. NPDC086549 TaxID=3365752 RepID=UPI0037F6D585